MAINVNNLRVYNMTVGAGSNSGGSGGSGGGGGVSTLSYTTNAIFHYDIGTSSSYGGTGTTVTDLTSNGYDGTLTGIGGISYNSAGAASSLTGYRVATPAGMTQYQAEVGNSPSFTYSGWYKIEATGGLGGAYSHIFKTDTLVFRAWFLPLDYSTTSDRGDIKIQVVNSGPATGRFNAFTDFHSVGDWVNIAMVADGTTAYFYVNAVLRQSLALTGTNFGTGSSAFAESSSTKWYPLWNDYNYFSFGQGILYSDALSSTQITANFDDLKSRYGY